MLTLDCHLWDVMQGHELWHRDDTDKGELQDLVT